MALGLTPTPEAIPPAVGDEDVTNGYVPWSTSKHRPLRPSRRTSFFRLLSAAATNSDVSLHNRRSLPPRGRTLEDLVRIEAGMAVKRPQQPFF